ncbi:MAG TPA: hypothetical protein VIL63_12920 [Terriglobales bacterium]
MPSRRLDDRIKELYRQISDTSAADVDPLLQELQAAIREKIKMLRRMATMQLIDGKSATELRKKPSKPD